MVAEAAQRGAAGAVNVRGKTQMWGLRILSIQASVSITSRRQERIA
jgi:hypothetical protein